MRVDWISSSIGDARELDRLSARMAAFYGTRDGRDRYQQMLDQQEDQVIDPWSIRHLMPRYVVDAEPTSILEVGCASGRLFRQLRAYGYRGAYAGIDMADHLTTELQARHPEAVWRTASAYDIPFADGAFDLCFSLYVLEHLVYPERALVEMLRVIRPGGQLVLAFPDMVRAGRLGSQRTGRIPGTAGEKLRQGRYLDALVTLFENRVRLPRLLRRAAVRVGPFPVNASPQCLDFPEYIGADVDAVYIASADEVRDWALARGKEVVFPAGREGELATQAFLTIHK